MLWISLVSWSFAAYTSDEATFLADPAWPACPQDVIADFEDLALAEYVDDAYGPEGLAMDGSTLGALVDDDVAGTECRGHRCARVPFEDGYGGSLAPWITLDFDPPIRVVSFWVVDFGIAGEGETATVVGSYRGETVETIIFTPGGNDVDGGVFVGLSFSAPVDTVTLVTQSAGDGIGVDDVRWPLPSCSDGDGDGQSAYQGDCDDADAARYPGASELCDGIDNGCAGAVPARETDADFDGWMDCLDTDRDGVATADGDCGPDDPTVYPGAPELCDGKDNTCVGSVPSDEADTDFDQWLDCVDTDLDGVTTAQGDCGPDDPTVYPGAPELCDGKDNGCVGDVPEEEADTDFDQWFDCVDTDLDGVTTAAGDCAPWDPTTYPGAAELCDGVDNTCAGSLPVAERDEDRDGWAPCEGDCDDADAVKHPQAVEHANGFDDNCDQSETGDVVGCASASTPRALSLALAAGLFVWLRRRGRRRLVAVGGALVAIPAYAAMRDGLAAWESEILTADYQDELRETNTGRQVVIQLSAGALQDLLLDYLYQNPELLRYDYVWSAGTTPWGAPLPDYGLHLWITGVDLEVQDGGRLHLTADVAGFLDSSISPTAHLGVLSGPAIVDVTVALTTTTHSDGTESGTITFSSPTVDTTGLTVDNYNGTNSVLLARVETALQASITATFAGWSIPLDALYDLVDVGRLPVAVTGGDEAYALDVGMRALALKTVADPSNGGEGLLMLGANFLSLPTCFQDLADSGEYTLYSDGAWDTFSANLIAPGYDAGLVIDNRSIMRVFWNLVWNEPVGGGTTRSERESIEADLDAKSCPAVCDTDVTLHSNFDLFLTSDPIADPENAQCDGESDGGEVLDLSGPGMPFYRTDYELHVDHIAWCDSEVDFGARMRFYVDNTDEDRPRLSTDAFAKMEIHLTDAVAVADALGCDAAEELNEGADSLEDSVAEVNAVLTRSVFDLAFQDAIGLRLSHQEVRPAGTIFSGRVLPEVLDWPHVRPWAPPVGTLAGLNVGDPDDAVQAEGSDAIARLCPPGYTSRVVTLSGQQVSWCEYADPDHGGDVTTLPPGAACGLDVHPRWRAELCDGVDNDQDGTVDEGFAKAAGDPTLADCYESLGGGDSDTGNDYWPVEYESRCGDESPRVACPAGFTAYGIWLDEDYAVCLLGVGSCAGVEADLLEQADLVTCVADGSGWDGDAARLPQGLVGGLTVPGYSEPAVALGGGSTCAAPFVSVHQATALAPDRVRNPVWRSGSYWLTLGADAGTVSYCTTEGYALDVDGDGLYSVQEDDAGGDPDVRSTDLDVLPDGLEVYLGFDVAAVDTDGDGLTDFEEWLIHGTDATAADTDGDGLPDGYELWVTHTDPLDADSDDNSVVDGSEERYQSLDDDWYAGLHPVEEHDTGEDDGAPSDDPADWGSGA